MTSDLLAHALNGTGQPYALLHRPGVTGAGIVEVLTGEVSLPAALADLPLPDKAAHGVGAHHEVLVLMPYRQLTERGFACADDGTPLVAMTVTGQQRLALQEVLARIPEVPTLLADGDFDVDDTEYEDVVRRIVKEMIGTGEARTSSSNAPSSPTSPSTGRSAPPRCSADSCSASRVHTGRS